MNTSEEAIQSTRGFNCIFIHSSLDDAGLTTEQFRVLAHLSRRAGDGVAWASNASMASICRVREETIVACLRELERRRIIVREVRPGKTNRFQIMPPNGWDLKQLESVNGVGRTPSTPPKQSPPQTKPPHPPEIKPPHPPETKDGEGNPIKGIQQRESNGAGAPDPIAKSLPPEAEYWNANCGRLPKVAAWSPARQRHLTARRNDKFWVDNFKGAVLLVQKMPFLMGQNDRGWRADFSWIIERPDSVAKIVEGKYRETNGAAGPKKFIPRATSNL